jgi:hypothetical protein
VQKRRSDRKTRENAGVNWRFQFRALRAFTTAGDSSLVQDWKPYITTPRAWMATARLAGLLDLPVEVRVHRFCSVPLRLTCLPPPDPVRSAGIFTLRVPAYYLSKTTICLRQRAQYSARRVHTRSMRGPETVFSSPHSCPSIPCVHLPRSGHSSP